MPRLVIPDDAPPVMVRSQAYQQLRTCDHQLHDSLPGTPQELAARIGDAEAVTNIRASSRFSAGLLGQCRALRVISIWGTGTDHVDLAAARERGITVTNTPAVSAIAVAEHTLSLIFAVAKQTIAVDRRVRAGEWPRAMVQQLTGRTLGLIGTGAIGREVARLAKALGMRVIAWTFNPKGTFCEWVSFEDVFRHADASACTCVSHRIREG